MKHLLYTIAAASLMLVPQLAAAAQPPRLVVQIVVSSMRADDLDRYADHFGDDGFLRLVHGGTRYCGSRYDYQQTSTPVSLATLTTGAQPSTHGVIGLRWRDYVENSVVELVRSQKGITPENLFAPTVGEALATESPESRIVTVAAEPESAVVMAGHAGHAYWMEPLRCNWTTSGWYDPQLPEWIQQFNREGFNLNYIDTEWKTLLERDAYRNTRRFDIVPQPQSREERRAKHTPCLHLDNNLDRMLYTPAGNSAVLGFAKLVVAHYGLGNDTTPDLLNICLDAPRHIAEAYGPESVEVEDMYYRLDRELADFLTFIEAQAGEENILVVLTSDHGTSASYDAGREPRDRFNLRQFEVIINSFLNVRYGVGKWLLEYEDKCIYLDHNLIYERGLDLADVQDEVATFAMQFRGVSHALSATAMRTSYFGSGYARRMQNSFYPRRSGDVILNFQPGWIEERDRCRSSSGSMYGYDTEVPLLFYGAGIADQTVERDVDMICVAPTLTSLLGVRKPAAAEGTPLPEIVSHD